MASDGREHPFAVTAEGDGARIHFSRVSLHLFWVPQAIMLFWSRGCIKKMGSDGRVDSWES